MLEQTKSFFQASLAARGAVQISLMLEYWAVYGSLKGTNAQDEGIGRRPCM